MEDKLPTELELNLTDFVDDDIVNELLDFLGDYLTNKYGYCHKRFSVDLVAQVTNIQWDTDDDEEENNDYGLFS